MRPFEDRASTATCPAFSSADIVKLQTATFLSLCAALDGAGVIRLADMATILSAHVTEADQEAWAQVVRAIAAVLSREPVPAPDHVQDDPPRSRAFTVVQGWA